MLQHTSTHTNTHSLHWLALQRKAERHYKNAEKKTEKWPRMRQNNSRSKKATNKSKTHKTDQKSEEERSRKRRNDEKSKAKQCRKNTMRKRGQHGVCSMFVCLLNGARPGASVLDVMHRDADQRRKPVVLRHVTLHISRIS